MDGARAALFVLDDVDCCPLLRTPVAVENRHEGVAVHRLTDDVDAFLRVMALGDQFPADHRNGASGSLAVAPVRKVDGGVAFEVASDEKADKFDCVDGRKNAWDQCGYLYQFVEK